MTTKNVKVKGHKRNLKSKTLKLTPKEADVLCEVICYADEWEQERDWDNEEEIFDKEVVAKLRAKIGRL